MSTDNKHESNSPVIMIGISIVISLLICLAIVAYLNHKPTKNALKNIPNVSLHPATPADYHYYLQLYPDLEIDRPPATLDTWTVYDMPNAHIIMHDTVPVGYAWVQLMDKVYYLTYFVVAKEHRRRGIGTAAIKLLKRVAQEKGFKRWGLLCDVLHTIPYKLYVKMGMHPDGQLFHLKAPSQSVKALTPQPTDYYTMIVHDPSKWTEIERDYKLLSGFIALSAKRGQLPVLMLDASHQIKGFTVLDPTTGNLWRLCVEDLEDFTIFLSLLQAYRKPNEANNADDWVHFGVTNAKGKQLSDAILQTLPGAVICEQYDYLEGSTSE